MCICNIIFKIGSDWSKYVEITPVLIDENGNETSFKSIIIQGEEASGGESTIFYETGGGFYYSDKIEYSDKKIDNALNTTNF